MVRSKMEYTSAAWDPYHNSLIQQLEKIQKIQRRAARWIFNDYIRFSSVSVMHVNRLILAISSDPSQNIKTTNFT